MGAFLPSDWTAEMRTVYGKRFEVIAVGTAEPGSGFGQHAGIGFRVGVVEVDEFGAANGEVVDIADGPPKILFAFEEGGDEGADNGYGHDEGAEGSDAKADAGEKVLSGEFLGFRWLL